MKINVKVQPGSLNVQDTTISMAGLHFAKEF